MSPQQIATNQRNAQKSTGPRTASGRAVSKMNALKHGILSKQVLVRGLHGKENAREFLALHQRFTDELQPVGPLEEMLVDQIVTAHWRLRRALTAESGEVAVSVDQGHWRRERIPNPQWLWLKWLAFGDPVFSMKESVLGNEALERVLVELKQAVERDGELTEAAVQNLVKKLRGPNHLTEGLEELRLRQAQNPEGLDAAALREKNKIQALAYLNGELSALGWRKEECEEREDAETEARDASAVLPSVEVLDKILRYETKLERQMYRAMSQLERLQRMRQGEAVPPPLTMEVSERAE